MFFPIEKYVLLDPDPWYLIQDQWLPQHDSCWCFACKFLFLCTFP